MVGRISSRSLKPNQSMIYLPTNTCLYWCHVHKHPHSSPVTCVLDSAACEIYRFVPISHLPSINRSAHVNMDLTYLTRTQYVTVGQVIMSAEIQSLVNLISHSVCSDTRPGVTFIDKPTHPRLILISLI